MDVERPPGYIENTVNIQNLATHRTYCTFTQVFIQQFRWLQLNALMEMWWRKLAESEPQRMGFKCLNVNQMDWC